MKLTEDLQKPTGIGTFGFDKYTDTNRESKTNSENGQGNSFPNYFAQTKNSNEKLSFVFGNNTATSVVGFNSISKEHLDNNNKNENVTENGNNENEIPILERDNDKLLENANEYQKSHDEKRIHLEEVERITGEEGEKHVLQVDGYFYFVFVLFLDLNYLRNMFLLVVIYVWQVQNNSSD